ncbi:hypothetical protein [Streptomyces sp. 7N604]|uniref:hypothetical protein n=1 Tax=Streptomyces sp. 7N604 TaxID=3457415 RepID=UPI003FD198FE
MPDIQKFSIDDAKWREVREQQISGDGRIFVGDIIGEELTNKLSAGYVLQGPGTSNSLTTSMDEVFVCLKGEYTIETDDGQKATAGPWEFLWLPKGTNITYSGKEGEETLAVFFTVPPYRATEYSLAVEEEYFKPVREKPTITST